MNFRKIYRESLENEKLPKELQRKIDYYTPSIFKVIDEDTNQCETIKDWINGPGTKYRDSNWVNTAHKVFDKLGISENEPLEVGVDNLKFDIFRIIFKYIETTTYSNGKDVDVVIELLEDLKELYNDELLDRVYQILSEDF